MWALHQLTPVTIRDPLLLLGIGYIGVCDQWEEPGDGKQSIHEATKV